MSVRVLTIGDYAFNIKGRQIVVATKEKNTEELRIITQLYNQWKYRHDKYPGRPLNGEFRLCRNPDCNNAFYALRFKIEQGQSLCCCRRCASIVFGSQKGEQVGSNSLQNSRRKKELIQWFLSLNAHDAANWIIDTVTSREPSSLRELNSLVGWQRSEIQDIIHEILRPCYPVAGGIIREFCNTNEGRYLQDLVRKR